MTNAELLAKIKAEIDKRYARYREKMKTDDFTYYEGMADALDLFEQFIDSFDSEPISADLEEAANEYAKLDEEGKWKDGGKYKGFIAGAKWGAEHLADNRAVAFKLGDEIAINGYKLVYDKDENAIRVAKVEPSGSSEDLEEAAKKYAHCPFTDDDGNFHEDAIDETAYHNFIAGAKWQKEQSVCQYL